MLISVHFSCATSRRMNYYSRSCIYIINIYRCKPRKYECCIENEKKRSFYVLKILERDFFGMFMDFYKAFQNMLKKRDFSGENSFFFFFGTIFALKNLILSKNIFLYSSKYFSHECNSPVTSVTKREMTRK